jgi:hypothetical protein
LEASGLAGGDMPLLYATRWWTQFINAASGLGWVLSLGIGVLPLVFARGAGAGAMHGIGICTCCGMLAATIFGIAFVPALYTIFERLRSKAG